jgi:TRAP-type C4-dicarboxylate transport system permease small subunit
MGRAVRRALDALYRLAGIMAGVFLVCIAAMVVAQIGARLIGVFLRGPDELIGYFLAASTFLALAYTFGAGGHIRVTLVLDRMPRRARWGAELVALVVMVVVTGYFAWHAAVMTWQSHRFGDMTLGLVAMPLWIPQTPMALGLLALFVAVVDALVVTVSGRRPSYLDPSDALRG